MAKGLESEWNSPMDASIGEQIFRVLPSASEDDDRDAAA
jgi:hypothetical protein